MSEKKYEDGHCPKCGSQRADVMAEHKDFYDDDVFQSWTYYKILECRGCGANYYKTLSANSEDYDHVETANGYEMQYNERTQFWPPPAKRPTPEWSNDLKVRDWVLGKLFDDVYTAMSNNLSVLAAIGMRTVFDRASELLGIDEGKPFNTKLTDLQSGGHITAREVGVLGALIDAGSAAAHRGWQPKPRELEAMLIILEAFLHRAFLLADVGAELDRQVPKKKPRTTSTT
ncbi:MAG TPA: DUF4145 domain-containing protein [Tabrizicola sp.]|nr:DUF4145 domain-containing protein [Tabrizicola sp.]